MPALVRGGGAVRGAVVGDVAGGFIGALTKSGVSEEDAILAGDNPVDINARPKL